METLQSIAQLKQTITQWQQQGQSIAFVPTMGYLQDGHMALVDKAKQAADKVVVSIFVNPMKFEDKDAYRIYPRTLEQDSSKLAEAQVDVLFTPSSEELFCNGSQNNIHIEIPELMDELCGITRPYFYRAVAIAMIKFMNIVQPNALIVGEKDIQRVVLIRKLIQELCFPVELISCPTIRESDGLAISISNPKFNKKQRKLAPELYHSLNKIAVKIKSGNRDYFTHTDTAIEELEQLGFKTDYVSVRRLSDLSPASKDDTQLVIMAAATLGKIRMNDNLTLMLAE